MKQEETIQEELKKNYFLNIAKKLEYVVENIYETYK